MYSNWKIEVGWQFCGYVYLIVFVIVVLKYVVMVLLIQDIGIFICVYYVVYVVVNGVVVIIGVVNVLFLCCIGIFGCEYICG